VAAAAFSTEPLAPGDKVWHVGLTARQEVAAQGGQVRRFDPVSLPLPSPPAFRDTNLDAYDLGQSGPGIGGVLSDKRGRVVALWASFFVDAGENSRSDFLGVPTELLLDVLAPLQVGATPALRTLGAELWPLSIADARTLGLPEEEARQLEDHAPRVRQALSVIRTTAGTPANEILQYGDLVLAIDGVPVTSFREVEIAGRRDSLEVRLLRSGRVLEVVLPTAPADDLSVDRVIQWAGAVLHVPHQAAASQRNIAPEGVYVTWTWSGSPAPAYGLRPTHRILQVDGQATADLDAFLAAVAGRPDRSAVRLKTVDLDGKVQMITLKLDLQYWPTFELLQTAEGWERQVR
jgi:S1-C subfamily serine protease